jgi:pimeloyl-ACP methyl ester carboxylesterase
MDTFGNDGLRFDVSTAGPKAGETIILLHGFPNDRTTWNSLIPALAAAGHRVLAPDQRGYSPGARPRRRRDYRLNHLTSDVLALADEAGVHRFHLVGHDWGALVAYDLASQHPDRVRTLTALSAPHPGAWRQSLFRSGQGLRSAYMIFFQMPLLPERLLGAWSGARLRRALTRTGLDADSAQRYADRACRYGLTGPLNWYRAAVLGPHRIGTVRVPTVLVCGDRDPFISREAVDLCRRWMVGSFRSEMWRGVSHWIAEEQPQRLTELILAHTRAGAHDGARSAGTTRSW